MDRVILIMGVWCLTPPSTMS